MTESRKKVGPLTLRARCADNLTSSAEWLLEMVASFAGRGKGLADGVIVQVGWSLLRLRSAGGELAVCEPDFDGNPFRDFRDDVRLTPPFLVEDSAKLIHDPRPALQTGHTRLASARRQELARRRPVPSPRPRPLRPSRA